MKDQEAAQKRELLKAKKEIAKNLLSQGMDMEGIMKATGLSRKQVEGLGRKR